MIHKSITRTIIPKNRCSDFWQWVAKMKKHHKILISSKAKFNEKEYTEEELSAGLRS